MQRSAIGRLATTHRLAEWGSQLRPSKRMKLSWRGGRSKGKDSSGAPDGALYKEELLAGVQTRGRKPS
jgi:hypothetical protein